MINKLAYCKKNAYMLKFYNNEMHTIENDSLV